MDSPASGLPCVRALLLAQERGTPMRRVPEALALAGQGFEGCRHTRRALAPKRQLLLLDVNPDAPRPIVPKRP